ncbi:MAG: metal-dependent hydrolase [Defluviitaleaceae bacterium]|nr:metal-dependent hydrolase [Defluviitaleaceae bacterium]
MTGSSHKAIGMAAGVAFSIYGFRNGNPAASLVLVSAPLAAMLPDIDHGQSKLGKSRKMIAKIAILASVIALIGAAWHHSWYMMDYSTLLIVILGVVIPMVILFKLSQSPAIKKSIGFVTKHRGIMHTLLIPACMIFASTFITEPYFRILLYGCTVGYVSHILADCLTKRGCPILFPITPKNISLTKIRTGSETEKMFVIILIIAIIAPSFFL